MNDRAGELRRTDLDPDPLIQFRRWYDEAAAAGVRAPEAMALATSTSDGAPSLRMVLLKGADERGFAFYTGYVSRKASELDSNPRAALLFYWDPLGRQVRIEGTVERVAENESDAYFATRPRGARARPRLHGARGAAPRTLGRLPPRPGHLRVLAAPRGSSARPSALPPRGRLLGDRAPLALARALQSHQHVDAVVVVRVLELTDRREARLLERPDRGTVVRVRVGDACRRRRSGEDDTAHELCDDPRAEAAARLLLFGEEQIHACDTLAGAGERCVLRVVRDEVGLDEPAARSSRSITESWVGSLPRIAGR